MTSNGVVVELMVNDIQNTISFYEEILGFRLLVKEDHDGKLEWAKMELDNFQISFKPAYKMKKEVPYFKNTSMGGTLSVCIAVDDLTGYYERIKKQFELLDYPHLTPCGSTQFSMLDPNGYVITFEQF